MKVLIFAGVVGRGGVTRVQEVLTAALARQGADCTILGQRYNENGNEIRWEQSFPFIQIRPVERLPLHPHLFEFLVQSAQMMVDHLMDIERDYDVVYVASPWWQMGGMTRWKLTRPVVSDLPDFAFDHVSMGGFLTAYFREASPRIALRSNLVVFASEFHRKWGEAHYGFNKTRLIRHSIDFTPHIEGEGVLPAGLPEKYLLAFHPMGHKDPETILRGYNLLRKGGLKMPLVLAGIGTDDLLAERRTREANYLFDVIRNLGMTFGKDIIVLGRVPDEAIPPLYRHAQVSIVASRSEGDLSGTVHESIMYHAPLVYDNLEVFEEQLVDGVHGVAFELGSGYDLAEAVKRVLADPEGAKRRADRAYADFSRRTADDVARDYIAAFESVLEGEQVDDGAI